MNRRKTSSWFPNFLALGLGVAFLAALHSTASASQKIEKRGVDSPVLNQSGENHPSFSIPHSIEKAEHLIQEDPGRSGHYWVDDPTYRVEFAPEGVDYFQKQPGGDVHLRFQLDRFRSGEQAIVPVSDVIRFEENRLIYQRTPAIQELYEVKEEGVEQSWVLLRPISADPADFSIEGQLTTPLTPKANPEGGVDFLDAEGRQVISYGRVTVVDQSGKRLAVDPVVKGDRLSITVPGEWLAQAAYPVVVDPLIGANVRVDSLTTTDNYPAIAFDGTNYLIVWQTGTPNATGTGTTAIKAVRVSNAGTVLDGTPLAIGDTAGQDDEFPSVAYDSLNGRYVVVWMTWNSTTSSDIFRNTVTTTGTVGTPANILAGGTSILAYPSVVCCDLNGNYYVVYGQSPAGVTNFTQYNGQTYDRTTHAAATASNPVATVSSGTISPDTEPRSAPRLYSLSTTKYLLAWETFGADANGDLAANLLTVTATPTYTWGTEVSIAATAVTLERYPRAAFDGANALIVYQRGGATAADVLGRFVTPGASNLTLGSGVTVSAVVGSDQSYPDVAWVVGACSANPVNRYLVVWQDYRNNATNPDIYGSPVNTAGTVEAAVAVSTNSTYIKQWPVIAADSGSCGYMAAWSDNRNSATTSYDIYAQQVGYPNISNLSPADGGEGNTISINGTGFGPDPGPGNRSMAANHVMLGATQVPDANILAWTETPSPRIDFSVPDGVAPGTYASTVTAGEWTSNAVNFNVTLAITTASLASGHQWVVYPGATLAASGGTLPYTWSIASGLLPAGLTLDGATGAISGTPTGAEASEIVSFTVKVTDSSVPAKTATQNFSMIVYKLNTITVSPATPTITRGQQIQFTASGLWTDNYSQPNINSLVTWQSSNTLVSTIDTAGLATGQGLGTVSISATK